MAMSQNSLGFILRRGLRVAVILAGLLAGAGLFVFPAARQEWKGTLPGLCGVAAVLIAYAVLGIWGTARIERENPRLLRVAVGFGLAAAAIYATEIMLEYVLLPANNTRYGYVEFGLVFLCYWTAGFVAGLQMRRVRDGLEVAMNAALISTLLWYIVLLTATYIMKGTPQQAAVFRAEGNLEDFARRGAANFEAWVMQDFLGAGFYHLLLGLIIAAVLGAFGGVTGKLVSRWSKSGAAPEKASPTTS